MKRFVIDTNIYSAFKSNHPAVVARFREAEEIVVCSIVHGELLAGFKCGNREQNNTSELEAFLDRPRVSYVTTDASTAEFYAEIFKRLRAKGSPIPTNDIWIAASAMQHGLAVYTRDNHFDCISGLIVIPCQR
ncbi:MAG TPA: VapC toxin family PIN domain ribonuclease [Verrucomicrobia bacterium]|nr:VapC toxin family PIN domain ribonuclease [Verrucomicrobiota bacterium]